MVTSVSGLAVMSKTLSLWTSGCYTRLDVSPNGMRAFITPRSSSITVGDPKPLNRFVFHLPVLFNTALSAYTEQHVWQDDVEKCTQHVKQPESERLVVLLCPPSGAHGSLQPGLCTPYVA